MICIIKICSRKYCQIVFGGIRGINHSCYIWDMLACKGTACHYYLMVTHHTFVILVKTIQKKITPGQCQNFAKFSSATSKIHELKHGLTLYFK